MSNLIISEEQYKRLFESTEEEGIEYTSVGTQNKPMMNMHINHSMSDADNLGKNNADTRMFNYKHNLLKSNDDGSSMSEQNLLWELSKDLMTRARIFANSNGRYAPEFPSINKWLNTEGMNQSIMAQLKKLKTIILSKMSESKQANDYTSMIQWIDNWFSRHEIKNEVRKNLYDRAKNFNYDRNQQVGTKVEQYRVGTIPGTNVKFIALFGIDDFNFSDALKHGVLRPNGNTKEVMGYDAKNKIQLTYDNGIPANVENNFSREEGVDYASNSDHYKKQYGYGDENYTSQTMFIDKSIMYASYALKMEKYKPQYIVSAPSSSKFNHYYANALANKLGTAEYIPDFYKRNLINFRSEDGQEIAEKMRHDGIEESLIIDFQKKVNNMALREISSYISEPVRKMMSDNYNLFANISNEHYSRERVDMKVLTRLVINYTYNMMIKNFNEIQENNGVAKYIFEIFGTYNKYIYGNDIYLLDEVRKRIEYRIGRRIFYKILSETWSRINEMSDVLQTNGYKLKFNQPFKVTVLSKKTRPYLKGIYAVADKNFNENRELFSKFTHANFLIIDEDINSGTTLRNSIEALQDVMPEQATSNMMCLVNAYSSGGF